VFLTSPLVPDCAGLLLYRPKEAADKLFIPQMAQ